MHSVVRVCVTCCVLCVNAYVGVCVVLCACGSAVGVYVVFVGVMCVVSRARVLFGVWLCMCGMSDA